MLNVAYLVFGLALAAVGYNLYQTNVANFDQAILGWFGFAMPFCLTAMAYGLGLMRS